MNRSNRETRLCRRRLLYSQRMVAETPEQREARLHGQKKIRDGARRAAARAAQSLDMFCLACTLFRNIKLNAIAQSGSPPNVLHSPSLLYYLWRDYPLG